MTKLVLNYCSLCFFMTTVVVCCVGTNVDNLRVNLLCWHITILCLYTRLALMLVY